MARIYDDVTQLVGGTPLVRLNRLTEGLEAQVAVKLRRPSMHGSSREGSDRNAI